jgi:hypothetical protein
MCSAEMAAAAGSGVAAAAAATTTPATLGFRGYMEKPPWAQATETVGAKTILLPWSRAKSDTAWIYGRAGYIAVVHTQNIVEEHAAVRPVPLIGRNTTIAVLSGTFDETAPWTLLGTQRKTFDKRKHSPTYVDSVTEYKWLDDVAKPFIEKQCQGDAKAPLWLVFDPTSFSGVDADAVRDGMLLDRDVSGAWFREAKRPMFGDAIEIRPTGKENNGFVLDSSLFERLTWSTRGVFQNAAAEAESKVAQKKAWKPTNPPVDYKGPIRLWNITVWSHMWTVVQPPKWIDAIVGCEADAVKRGMEMIPEDGIYIVKTALFNRVKIVYWHPVESASPAAASMDAIMVRAQNRPSLETFRE